MPKRARNASLSDGPLAAAPGIVVQSMVAPAPQAGDNLVRGGTSAGRATSAGRPGQIVSAANRWRENYNPLRGLNMRRAVELLELGQRGDYAYLQWTYRFIERRNAILSGLLSRCEAPLLQYDWRVATVSGLPPGASAGGANGVENFRRKNRLGKRARVMNRPSGMSEDAFKAMAEAQKEDLTAAYNAIDNLRAAIMHLHKADFRGYAHLQKHRNPDGSVYHLEVLDQWCICRDGLAGNWWWNPDSRSTSAPLQFLGAAFCIGGDSLPAEDFIIREVERPIDEVGLVHSVRTALVEKDWDGFIEIYTVPGGVVTMPANVPPGKEAEYEQTAKMIAEGGSGALPAGSTYEPNAAPRNVDPFTPRISELDQKLILAGTGGKLTMMTDSGAGGQMRGSSNVHERAFGEISDGRAAQISEIFQRDFDAEVLASTGHGDEPFLAYFEFGAEDREDVTAICTNVASLKQAGKDTDTDWLSEKTGYVLTDSPPPQAVPGPNSPPGEVPPAGNDPQKNEKPGSRQTDDDDDDDLKASNRLDQLLNRAGVTDLKGFYDGLAEDLKGDALNPPRKRGTPNK